MVTYALKSCKLILAIMNIENNSSNATLFYVKNLRLCGFHPIWIDNIEIDELLNHIRHKVDDNSFFTLVSFLPDVSGTALCFDLARTLHLDQKHPCFICITQWMDVDRYLHVFIPNVHGFRYKAKSLNGMDWKPAYKLINKSNVLYFICLFVCFVSFCLFPLL